jgi:hypothetical protein
VCLLAIWEILGERLIFGTFGNLTAIFRTSSPQHVHYTDRAVPSDPEVMETMFLIYALSVLLKKWVYIWNGISITNNGIGRD